MDERITLDREAFRSLASKTRVDILKSLDRRRKMLAELSREFGMSPSTIKEHMDNLSGAGLVVQIDDGHKWKYYELTSKGRGIVRPTGTRILVILGLSAIALMITAIDLFRSAFLYAAPLAARNADATLGAGKEASQAVPAALPAAGPIIPVFHILGIAVFTAIFGISLGYVMARRTGPPVL
jgi:DNA-binding transcriptional ArsR family regulator